MYQLAYVLYDGQYDEVQKLFSSLKELREFADKTNEHYVWRKVKNEKESS